jgi:hypothetical protein
MALSYKHERKFYLYLLSQWLKVPRFLVVCGREAPANIKIWDFSPFA